MTMTLFRESLNYLTILSATVFAVTLIVTTEIPEYAHAEVNIPERPEIEVLYTLENRLITAFNTVEWQTDQSPCFAGTYYICGRDDVIACPRNISKGTWVRINGKEYECLDRTHYRFDGRFDISLDKDIQGAKNWGVQYWDVEILDK